MDLIINKDKLFKLIIVYKNNTLKRDRQYRKI